VLHRDGGEGPLQATASALKELTVPLIGSTLTPIVVFLPLITITRVTGTFFRALAIAMSVSLLTSLVLALVWTSNLSTYLVRRGQHAEHLPEGEHLPAPNVDGMTPEEAEEAHARYAEALRIAQIRRMMAAEEASLRGGVF